MHSLEDIHTTLRATMRLAPEHAELLGVETIRVCIKPSADNWYGREFRRELAYYRVARFVGTPGLVPMVERRVDARHFAADLEAQLTEEQADVLYVLEGNVEMGPGLHGSVQLWVDGYRPELVGEETDAEHSEWLAMQITAPDDPTDPLWQALSDMFTLDYALGNSDRQDEYGAFLLPNGRERLVMLDHGDVLQGLWNSDYQEPGRYFRHVGRYSRNLLARLELLDEERLREMWAYDDELLVPERYLDDAAERIDETVALIRESESYFDGKSPALD